MLLTGCATVDPAPAAENMAKLEGLMAAARSDIEGLGAAQADDNQALNQRLTRIDAGLRGIPKLLEAACQRPTTVTTSCDADEVQTIIMNDDKMVVGEAEYVWLEPPGISLTARIDTGASSNVLIASEVIAFERDGDDWARFTIDTSEEEGAEGQTVTVERKVRRVMKSSKRPVVRLRIALGDVRDSFDFILTERERGSHAIQLGRGFLQDVALVDVGRQFIQPRLTGKNDKEGSTGR
ncbi:MAG: RimK/LysX family protein [Pseudomonadota bacterium]